MRPHTEEETVNNDRIERSPDLSRRAFLQASTFAGVAAFLAACTGTGGEASAPGSISIATAPPVATPSGSAPPTPVPSPTGPLKFANWPAYIDLSGTAGEEEKYAPGSSPTIEQFKEKYGVDVDYEEKIQDNKTFYATIQPQLQAGSATGWDLIVVTDWLAAKIISKSWA